MAFTASSGMLKFGFLLSTLLFFLGLATLISVSIYAKEKQGDFTYCILYFDNDSRGLSSSCNFTSTVGAIIAVAGIALFGMDYVTWKRSENFKGRRAAITSLVLTVLMTLFSFCNAIVLVLGIKKTCDFNGGCSKNDKTYKGVYSAISCSALAGLFFIIYGVSEYIQYRKRHINGDKW